MTEYEPIFFDIETTGLNPMAQDWWSGEMQAQVTCVGLGRITNWDENPSYEDAETEVKAYYDNTEYRLLNLIPNKVEEMAGDGESFLVGYNSRNFDHPYLGARFSRLRLDGRPFTQGWKRLDMMNVAGRDDLIAKRYPKQDEYLEAVGLSVDDPYDGSDMPKFFENGEWRKIKHHVEKDVEALMGCFLKRKDIAMKEFYEHYDVEVDANPAPEIDIANDGDE